MSVQEYLTFTDHNRDISHLSYIYPVVSRRAKGVSVGINLNINSACNWRCIYCQVPNLKRGSPNAIDLNLLEHELDNLLNQILHGDFMLKFVAKEHRQLQDIAFSGNGEPTSAKEFPLVVEIVKKVLDKFDLLGKVKIRLITNGSLIDKAETVAALQSMARCNGEVWFKLDSGTKAGIARINDVNLDPETHLNRLIKCAKACPTFIQTCMLTFDGLPPNEAEITVYLEKVKQVAAEIKGVHLYGLARPSMQAEAIRLERLPAEWLEKMAERIRQNNIEVFVSP